MKCNSCEKEFNSLNDIINRCDIIYCKRCHWKLFGRDKFQYKRKWDND